MTTQHVLFANRKFPDNEFLRESYTKNLRLGQVVNTYFLSAYVINCDAGNESGEHWVAVSFDKHEKAEYFDNCSLSYFGSRSTNLQGHYSLSGWTFNRRNLIQASFQKVGEH